ncbi:MAG: hypothetical protein JW841_15235 [Deltaproteobacteria bacterium]|nr:hypothetical protein [Deltaproteobacteria bacterium]
MRNFAVIFSAIFLINGSIAYGNEIASTTSINLPDAMGIALNGAPGMHRISSAKIVLPGELVIGFTGEYFSTDKFFLANDHDHRWVSTALINFTPFDFLSIWNTWVAADNTNDSLTPRHTSYRGNPEIGAILRYKAPHDLDTGLLVSLMMPTSSGGKGFNAKAAKIKTSAIASYKIASFLEVAANLGYVIDNTTKMFHGIVPSQQRFTAGIYGKNVIEYGLGVQGSLAISPDVFTGGFIEFSGTYAAPKSAAINPARATIGAKMRLAKLPFIEMAIGSDVRLAGAPQGDHRVPGIAPWEAFIRFTGNWSLFKNPNTSSLTTAKPCGPNSSCEPGLECRDGYCVKPETDMTIEPEKVPTFKVIGTIIDKSTDKPIKKAQVTVAGFTAEDIKINKKTGKFVLAQIPVDGGLIRIRVEAKDYKPAEETVAKDTANATKQITFSLIPTGANLPAILKGNLIDATTGKPIRGVITINDTQKRIIANKSGAFSVELHAGRYDITITSRGHLTQNKNVLLKAGEVVILNVDMTPKRK